MTNNPRETTSGKLKLGYKASAEQFGPRTLLNYAVEAEETGFDSVWISDHFQPWRHTNGHAPQALVWLGAAGERTRRVVLGTSVLTPLSATLRRLSPRLSERLASSIPGA